MTDRELYAPSEEERLREHRARAWAFGQSLGPWVHGLPEDECLRIETRRDEILREVVPTTEELLPWEGEILREVVPTTEEPLAKYATRQPRRFVQFDGFKEVAEVVGGERLFGMQTTYELMRGSEVRVLVGEGADAEMAARMLRKTADWIEREPEELAFLMGARPEPEAEVLAAADG